MEEEAERIYKDEHGLLLDDEAASTRDAMWVARKQRKLSEMWNFLIVATEEINSSAVDIFFYWI